MGNYGKCARLDSNGKRCKNNSIGLFTYHGDGEIYRNFKEEDTTWVVVPMCALHKTSILHETSKWPSSVLFP